MLLQEKIAESDGVNWEGLAAIIIFYLAVLMVRITFIILEFVQKKTGGTLGRMEDEKEGSKYRAGEKIQLQRKLLY